MSTIIPAPVVTQLRGALYHQISREAEPFGDLDYEPQAAIDCTWPVPMAAVAGWGESFPAIDRARALLDRIGWAACDPEQDVAIDLERHRRVLADALANELLVRRSLATEPGEAAEGQRERASAQVAQIEAFVTAAGVDVEHEPEQTVTVPDDHMNVLMESLMERLRFAAEQVEGADLDETAYPDRLERFDAVRATLDAIGWGEVQAFDANPHMDVLADALGERLETERALSASARSSAGENNRREVVRADRYAVQVETLFRLVGLAVPAGDAQ
jgi:hypothetical protein